MRILILNWRDPLNPKSGGAEIVTLRHAKSWVKKGHSVTWFTTSFPSAPYKEVLDGIEIIRKGNSLTVYFFAVIFYFSLLKSFDIVIDEIHGLPFFTPLYVKKPKIVFIHEVAKEIWDYMYPFPINIIGKFIEPWYFKLYKQTMFWVTAPSTVDDLESYGISRKHCNVILSPANNASVESLPKKEKKLTCIFVSRLVKMKGIEEIIKSFAFIIREVVDAQLWVIGGGTVEYMNFLKKMAGDYGLKNNISFFGNISEAKKLEYMRHSHFLLHASVKEGWGLVVIEAASQATPAVVYNVAGLKDSVKNGVTGVVLSKNSPQEMAREILKLTKDKRRYKFLQKNALALSKNLTWEKATKQSLELLQNVVKNNN